MMKKKRIYIILLGLTAILAVPVGCWMLQPSPVTYRLMELKQAALRYDKMDSLERCEAIKSDADTLFREEYAGVDRCDVQGLCCKANWVMSGMYMRYEVDSFLVHAVDYYNVFAACNAIWADYEIWLLGNMSGEGTLSVGKPICGQKHVLVDPASIEHGISDVAAGCITDYDMSQVVCRYRDGILWCIRHPDEWNSEMAPEIIRNRFWEDILVYYLLDTESVDYSDPFSDLADMGDLDISSAEIASYTYQADASRKWWHDLIANRDFESRCRLALIGTHLGDSLKRWDVEVMMTLMQSGQYSPLLPRIWRTWRCQCQEYFYGNARDAIIQNHTYERYRKMVYRTVLRYLVKHPFDRQAHACAYYLLFIPSMAREGYIPFGFDCLSEEREMGV